MNIAQKICAFGVSLAMVVTMGVPFTAFADDSSVQAAAETAEANADELAAAGYDAADAEAVDEAAGVIDENDAADAADAVSDLPVAMAADGQQTDDFASSDGTETETDAAQTAAVAEGEAAVEGESSVESGVSADDDAEAPVETAFPEMEPGTYYDRADFYSDEPDSGAKTAMAGETELKPMHLSDEMKYFAKYESSCNYDQGFSPYDGYHAMGYYQFDIRYGLYSFLEACYNYNTKKYSMFKDVRSMSKDELEAAWHAAYAKDPSEFSGLQDGWAYQQYYLPAEEYMARQKIPISDRADCVKGLCWGLCNLFGTSGWHKFVGGYADGWDWNGEYHDWTSWPGAGLKASMDDYTFATTLCQYVIDNVGVFYAAQPQYHEGWTNRYKSELADIQGFLGGKWVKSEGRWMYELRDGSLVTNTWRKVGKYWYWFNFKGYAAQDCWMRIKGYWYMFDSKCHMVTNTWAKQDGIWKWLGSNGKRANGWVKDGGYWYYLDPDNEGAMVKGVFTVKDEKYYFRRGGQLVQNWGKDNGLWHYATSKGVMLVGWQQYKGFWYYMDKTTGVMVTGWKKVGSYWYFFDENGRMASSRWAGNYYLLSNGKMATNMWIGDYYVGEDGKWIEWY